MNIDLTLPKFTPEQLATANQSSREMFVARLQNMQLNGHTWLTIVAVLSLLSDCDMLAQQELLQDPRV